MDYTIIGHQVNLAARLEQAAKPDTVLISHDTYALVKDYVDVEEREPLTVKGNSRTIQAFTVVGLKEPALQSLIQIEETGLNVEVDLSIADRDVVTKALRSALEQISKTN
jgi:hypothetical protein